MKYSKSKKYVKKGTKVKAHKRAVYKRRKR